ncbi:hypothetical protein K1W54_04860 [Micromonospora sp. CPCC 205371]|nr:hypothetical protein [Micromonospora sp. CPCC 205371]
MIERPVPLTCTGREVDKHLRPVGEECGTKFNACGVGGWLGSVVRVDSDGSFGPMPSPSEAERDIQARAPGWSVAVLPDGSRAVTCPRCRKPNAELAAEVRAIQQELLTRQPDRPAIQP